MISVRWKNLCLAALLLYLPNFSSAAQDIPSGAGKSVAALQKLLQQRRHATCAADIRQLQSAITGLTDQLMLQALASRQIADFFHLAKAFDDPASLHYDPLLASALRKYCSKAGFTPRAAADHLPTEQALQMRQQALKDLYLGQKQQRGLFAALFRGDIRSALLLAVWFNDQIKPDLPMAVNAAWLAAVNMQPQASELLLELDNTSQLAMAMQAIWQNQLRTGQDLARANIDSRELFIDMTVQKTPENLRKMEDLMLADPDAFFLSGTVFRLTRDLGYTAAEIKALFRKVPASAEALPVLVSGALLAGELQDHQWQLAMTDKLLALIARDASLQQQRGNYRARLLTTLPEVLKYPAADTAADIDLYFNCLWNLAVDMRINALLAAGKAAEAENFLKKYPRTRLPIFFRQLEKNLVKRFAPQLLRQDRSVK